MTWREIAEFSEETVCLFEIVEHFLTKYFGHSAITAEQMIDEYIRRYKLSDIRGLLYHDLPWGMATRIQYVIGLNRGPGGRITWEVENNLRNTPSEALAYMREHYWNKYPMFDR